MSVANGGGIVDDMVYLVLSGRQMGGLPVGRKSLTSSLLSEPYVMCLRICARQRTERWPGQRWISLESSEALGRYWNKLTLYGLILQTFIAFESPTSGGTIRIVWERQLWNKMRPVNGHWTKVGVGGWGTWHWKPRTYSFLIMNEACRPSTIQWTQVRIKSSCVGFRDAIVYATQHQLIRECLKFSTGWEYQLHLISQVILEAGMVGEQNS